MTRGRKSKVSYEEIRDLGPDLSAPLPPDERNALIRYRDEDEAHMKGVRRRLGDWAAHWRAPPLDLLSHANPQFGADLRYQDPEKFMRDIIEYFEWNNESTILESRMFGYKGEISSGYIDRMRAPSVPALRLRLGLDSNTWEKWKEGRHSQFPEEFKRIAEWAEDVISTIKFEGAAAEQFNVQIIMRDLGMSDKREVTTENTHKLITQYELPSNGRDMIDITPEDD